MSTYAARTDVERYIEGWITDDPVALERLIQRAEREVDRIIFPWNTGLPPTQVISISQATGGSFTVSFGGSTSSNQSFAPTAASLQAALQALPSIGSSHVTVLGTNPYTLVWDKDWVEAAYPTGNIPTVTVDGTNLQGTPVVGVTTIEGRKINPPVDLTQSQAIKLANAVCAQVEYRNAMGEAFFVRPQYDSVRGPDFTTTGRLPKIAPKAKLELAGSGLIFRGGRARLGGRQILANP